MQYKILKSAHTKSPLPWQHQNLGHGQHSMICFSVSLSWSRLFQN